jgi:hypothetical protein
MSDEENTKPQLDAAQQQVDRLVRNNPDIAEALVAIKLAGSALSDQEPRHDLAEEVKKPEEKGVSSPER